MSTSATTCSDTPGSLSAGTSVEKETGLSSNNRNNLNHDLAQTEELFVEGDGVRLQVANSSHIDMGAVARHARTFLLESNDQNAITNEWLDAWLQIDDEIYLPSYPVYPVDLDEMVIVDIPDQSNISVPSESNCAPSHTLSTTSNPISEVERTMSKVKATDKPFKGTTSSVEGYSSLPASKEAVLAAQLEYERVKLENVVQQNIKLKMENPRMAKDGGTISNEEYIQHVKALLNL